MTDYEYWLWLSYIKDMWHNKMELLYKAFGSVRAIYNAGEKTLNKIEGITLKDTENILASKKIFDLDKTITFLDAKKIKFTFFEDQIFPDKLKKISNPPMVLFYKGSLPEKSSHTIGIVGARACSEYGKSMAYKIARELAESGISVVSGMARGIDAMAHRGCIKGGNKTYAVLGCGVDVCYPGDNIELYQDILKNGGIISEYIPSSEPLAWHFPERNRIISGLSEGVAMIEAREKSGSFITVDHALSQGKTVFALPGRITEQLSTGCNKLIYEGAIPLLSTEQMIFEMGMGNVKEYENKMKKNIFLEKEIEMLYSCFGFVPITVQELINKTGIGLGEIYEKITRLQIKGLIKEVAKGQYIKVM